MTDCSQAVRVFGLLLFLEKPVMQFELKYLVGEEGRVCEGRNLESEPKKNYGSGKGRVCISEGFRNGR